MVMKVEAWVDTRIFGASNLPGCALIPFADALNHSDNWIAMNSVNKEIHKLGKDAPGGYFRKRKFLIDFSVMYDGDVSKLSP